MQKYLQFTFLLLLAASIAACGGSDSTTAATPIYDLPAVLAAPPANPLAYAMGGAVQGTPLVLNDGNINTVSTMPNISGSAGFGNYSTPNGDPAMFRQPIDIATDGIDLYVADYMNNVIRKVSPSGEVRTLTDPLNGAYLVFNRPSGITVDASNIYVVANGANTVSIIDKITHAVTTIGSASGQTGSVDSAVPADVRFNQPTGITTDGVNLYVTDYGNHTVRRIDIATKAVSTLAGTSGAVGSADGVQGTARFNLPGRITTDGTSLYLTDVRNRTIRRIDIKTGTVTTIAGTPGPMSTDFGTADGTGPAAHFNTPNGITTDGINLYVTDTYLNSIRKIVISTGVVTTISGIPSIDAVGGAVNTIDGAPSFNRPAGITTDGTSLFVADGRNNTIRKIQ